MFETLPVYRPTADREDETLQAIGARLAQETGETIEAITALNTGQNPSYAIYIEGRSDPAYFLKIIARKGYPSLQALVECDHRLQEIGLRPFQEIESPIRWEWVR